MNLLHNQAANFRRLIIAVIAIGLGGGSFGFAAAAAAAFSTPPALPVGLSIAISDGVAETTSGASLTYTATVANSGAVPVTAELVITLPSFATFSNAGTAHVDKSDASWQVTIAPGKSASRHATADVGRIPRGDVRVTTLATLYVSADSSRILVRAADANAIEGVVDPAHTVGKSREKTTAGPSFPALLAIGVTILAALSVLAVSGALVLRQRRRRASWGLSERVRPIMLRDVRYRHEEDSPSSLHAG